jgi:hypothetical protein
LFQHKTWFGEDWFQTLENITGHAPPPMFFPKTTWRSLQLIIFYIDAIQGRNERQGNFEY